MIIKPNKHSTKISDIRMTEYTENMSVTKKSFS